MTLIGPNMEITESDWDNMKAELENYSRGKFWRDYTWHAGRMAVIDPEQFKSILITDDDWIGMLRELENYRRQENWDAFAARFARMESLLKVLVKCTIQNNWVLFASHTHHMKIVDPDRFATVKITDKQWEGMMGKLDDFRQHDIQGKFTKHASYMKTIDAERYKQVRISAQDWEKIAQELQLKRQKNYWGAFAAQASRIKTLLD